MKTYSICFGILIQACLGFSQPALYTFSGNVGSLFYDGGGILAAQNVSVGDPVAASFVVDFGAPGFYLLNDGSTNVPTTPESGNVYTEYFYSRLASGTLLPEVNGGFNNRPEDVSEYFTGWNRSDPLSNEGVLWGGSGDSYFMVRRSDPRYVDGLPYLVPDWAVRDWQVGTEVRGVIVAWNATDWSIAWADMRLDAITPIPEPSIISILSFSTLIFCAVISRKADQKNYKR